MGGMMYDSRKRFVYNKKNKKKLVLKNLKAAQLK